MEPPGKRPRSAGVTSGASSSSAPARVPAAKPGMRDLKSVLNFMFTEPKRYEGRVNWFDKSKSFGKITPDKPRGQMKAVEDIFVHRNEVEGGADGANYAALAPGALVTYELGTQDNGKPCAKKVRCEGLARIMHSGLVADAEVRSVARDEQYRSLLLKDLQVATYQEKGKGKVIMEDAYVQGAGRELGMLGTSKRSCACVFLGVCDGHGGASCCDFVALHLERSVYECLREQKKREASCEMVLRSSLLGGFKTTEHNFLQYANKLEGGATRAWANSGTTACTATLFGPDDEGRLKVLVANVGDSRVVLGKRDGLAVRLSTDHKPEVPAERKRIEAEGGTVAQFGGTWRVILKSGRGQVASGLSVARSFGDQEFKVPVEVVSPVPEISSFVLDLEDDILLIIASDGVWSSFSDSEAVGIVAGALRAGDEESPKRAAQLLVESAHARDASDDKTAMVVWLGGMPSEELLATPAPAKVAEDIDFARLAPAAASAVDESAAFAAAGAAAAPAEGADIFEAADPELALLDDIFSAYAAEMQGESGASAEGSAPSAGGVEAAGKPAEKKGKTSRALRKVF